MNPLAAMAELRAAGVDFILIGGVAGVVHGASRVTNDIDVLIDDAPANLDRLGEVLVRWGCRLYDAPPDLPFSPDGRTLRAMESLVLQSPFGKLDLFRSIPGVGRFADARTRVVEVELEGEGYAVLGLEALIASKAILDRPKDREALPELRALLAAAAEAPAVVRPPRRVHDTGHPSPDRRRPPGQV